MALQSLKQIPKDTDKGLLTVDLSDVAGDGAELRFREPKAADLFPDAKELGSLRVAFAEFPEAMLYQIYLLGRCYVADPTDSSEESPLRAFGNLARTSKQTFFRILGEFISWYPTDDLQGRVKEAKNALEV
jgi:hypothetical protein